LLFLLFSVIMTRYINVEEKMNIKHLINVAARRANIVTS